MINLGTEGQCRQIQKEKSGKYYKNQKIRRREIIVVRLKKIEINAND